MVYPVSLPPFGLIVCTMVGHLHVWGCCSYSGGACVFCVRSQTIYPSLRSSGVTAALLTPSLGLRPPPRLEMDWTVLQSRDAGGLKGPAPVDEVTPDAEALVASG